VDKHSAASQYRCGSSRRCAPRSGHSAALLALRSERKSPQTVKVYSDGVRVFLRWCTEHGHSPALDRDLMKSFVADLLDAGAEASTARSRQLAMRPFPAWLEEDGDVDEDPLLGRKAPKLDAKVTNSRSDNELRRLIKACSTKEFRDQPRQARRRPHAPRGLWGPPCMGNTASMPG
jgi:site-specific recombinase XerC